MKKKGLKILSVLLSIVLLCGTVILPAFTVSAETTGISGEYANSRYMIIEESMTWEEAEAYCSGLGGHLSTITSQEEQDYLTELVKTATTKDKFWIGAYKNDDGEFVWVTDESSSFENWDAREPNNTYGNETCVMMYKSNGKWNDECHEGRDSGNYRIQFFGFICEWDVKQNGSLIGTLEDYVTLILDMTTGDNCISEITVDGVKYPVAKGVLELSTAEKYENKKVGISVKNGIVVSICLVSQITTKPQLSITNDITLIYKNGQFTNRRPIISGKVVNSIKNTVDKELAQLMESLTLTDVTVTLSSSNPEIIYFKDGWSKVNSLTFSVDNILPGESKEFTNKMHINKKYRFPENLQNDSVKITCTLNARHGMYALPQVIETKEINILLVNEDYRENEIIKTQSFKDLLDEMEKKVDKCPVLTEEEKESLRTEINKASCGNTVSNAILNIDFPKLEQAVDLDCEVSDADKLSEKMAKDLLDIIIDNCDKEGSATVAEIEKAVQPLENNELFQRFSVWFYAQKGVPVGNYKEIDKHCPIDIIVTDEDDNIVLSIINDKVVTMAEGAIGFVVDGKKTIYLPTDIDHKIQTIATDNGTMDYSVTEYSSSGEKRVVSYSNVELIKDKVCLADIPRDLMPEESVYNLTEMTLDKLTLGDASLTCQNDISFEVEERLFSEVGYENPRVVFDCNDGNLIEISDYSVEDDKYVFNYGNIAPDQMCDIVNATLYADFEGATYCSKTKKYSLFAEHNMAEANCATPSTCTLCDYAVGEPESLNHDYSDEWTIDVEASYNADGIKSRHCKNCNSVTDTINVPALIIGDLNYTIVDDSVKINKYNGTQESIIIPETIDGLPVKTIASYAFYGKDFIKQIELPDGITELGTFTFYNCSNLESINLPLGINTIENHLFFGCKNLKNIEIHNNITTIQDYAFEECGLTKIIIPNSVESIGVSAFKKCQNLKAAILPNSITTLSKRIFDNCISLEKVYFSNSVKQIDEYAFDLCSSLQKVYFSGSDSDWESITFGGSNQNLTSANIHFEDCEYCNNKCFLKYSEPSCTEVGKWEFVCENCEQGEILIECEKLEHNFETESDTDGNIKYTCTVCGEVYKMGANGELVNANISLGDLDGNSSYNAFDAIMLSDSIINSLFGDGEFDPNCDLNGDGVINLIDLVRFKKHLVNKDAYEFTYEIVDGTVTITGIEESAEGAITVPFEIEGCPVTQIYESAFITNTKITSILMHPTIVYCSLD